MRKSIIDELFQYKTYRSVEETRVFAKRTEAIAYAVNKVVNGYQVREDIVPEGIRVIAQKNVRV